MKNEVKIKVDGDRWRISYTPIPSTTAVLRQLKNRRRMKDRTLLCYQTKHNLKVLRRLNPSLQIVETKERKKKQQTLMQVDYLPDHLSLYPFQEEGVEFLVRKKKALLADEMGTGKTIQVLGALAVLKNERPFVVVCPSCAKDNWEVEVKKWLQEKAYVCHGRTPKQIPANTTIIIINYDILNGWLSTLLLLRPKGVVADESHHIKNYKAIRTKAFKKLAAYKKYKFLLSGTPVTNKPIEFFVTLQLLDPKNFGNFWAFVNRYCGPKSKGGFMDYTGASNIEELHNLLTETVMLRRLKEEVLTQLPPKVRSVQLLPLQSPTKYKRLEQECTGQLADIEKMRQECVAQKMKGIFEWLDEFATTGEKAIVFVHHKQLVNDLKKHYGERGVYYTGSTSKQERKKAVDGFQNGDKQFFFGNIKAAGIAITLTSASYVIFLELPLTPGALDQAEDRAHRITQTRQVTIYYLLAKDSYELVMYKMLDDKRKVLSKLLNGEEISHAEYLEMAGEGVSPIELMKRVHQEKTNVT